MTAEMDWQKFGKEVNRERVTSMAKLAKQLDMHEQSVSNAIKGSGVNVRNYLVICEWMNASPYDFLIEE